MNSRRILIVGATGYIGGRLVPRLLQQGFRVRCLARDPDRLAGWGWQGVQVIQGDVLKPETLPPAVEGVEAAYYLVHSMGAGEKGFEARDQQAARHFARAARDAGVRRVIYLGGLGSEGDSLSPHLRSRQQVGDLLRQEGPPVTEFRAAMIVGSGSLSFEMMRYLTERLPVMICPRWVRTRSQPIGVGDVLRYLLMALDQPLSEGRTLEIGGADVLSYADMMLEYARQRGLVRKLLHVPLLTPRLSSYWINLVTPIPAALARPLVEGLRNEVVVRDPSARELFPFEPMGYAEAVRLALERWHTGEVETIWSTPLSRLGPRPEPVALKDEQGMLLERRQVLTQAPAESAYATFTGIGGQRGWFVFNWAWKLRGLLDRLLGGVGLRRGRRHPQELRVGEALDFWRVEALQPGRLMRLRAEMKVPGRAWLEFRADPVTATSCRLTQTAYFEPHGLSGLLYWYALYPFHQLIFSRMAWAVARRAEQSHQTARPSEPGQGGEGRENAPGEDLYTTAV